MSVVGWESPSWNWLVAWFVLWEVVYRGGQLCLRSFDGKLRSEGPSYVVSLAHAVLATVWSAWNLFFLWTADVTGKSIVSSTEGRAAMQVVYPFLAYLVNDLMHIAFPKLGSWPAGVDSIAHHIGFMALGTAVLGYGIYPFPVCWLLLGELSSIPLMMRFFLINSGHGETLAMTITNYTFALFFLCTRVLSYWAGLVHILWVLSPLLLAPERQASLLLVRSIEFGCLLGGLLNAYWMGNIIKMALRGGKKDKA